MLSYIAISIHIFFLAVLCKKYRYDFGGVSMKLSDYVFQYIKSLGIDHVFYLPGGGAMHLDDSLGHTEGIKSICMLHEQACAIASEAYSRIKENYSCCVITAGPGVTNTFTGLAAAWLDGTPIIFISGQAKRDDLVGEQGIRQFGIQELNVAKIVAPFTKYSVLVTDPQKIKYELQKATALCREGKPGPVWLDIPLDVQATNIDPNNLECYTQKNATFECKDSDIQETIKLFNKAKRPLILLGHGIRQAGAIEEMQALLDYMKVPVMTTWNGVDLVANDYKFFYGRPGAVGHRYSNFIQQNADFVLTIGTRLNLLSTGYNFEAFLKNANHVMVEIDANEMNKKSVHPALKIHADAKSFLQKLLEKKSELDITLREAWLSYCNKIKAKYPLFIKEQEVDPAYICTYNLVDAISNELTGNDIYQFTSSGTCADIAMYTLRVKKGMRAFLTKGLGSMGFDIPASIGSCIASGGKRVVCVTGDGGFMMNIQELATLKSLNLPVKIFVVDNNGYAMVYSSQLNNFHRLTGAGQGSGLYIPDLKAIVQAFGLPTYTINKTEMIASTVHEVMESSGAAVCIVHSFIGQRIVPRQTNYMKEDGQMASRPLEDMSPLLDRKEFQEAMKVE